VKIEGENPTGSMKDRMAQAMIARAENDGRLNPGDTVVEYTGGSGVSAESKRSNSRKPHCQDVPKRGVAQIGADDGKAHCQIL
jgi:threonine synthase